MAQPAIIHSHHHSSQIPTPWLLGYITIGILAWLATAIILIRHEQATSHEPADNDTKFMAIVGGLIGGIAWPLAIIGGAIWLIIQRLTQPTPTKTTR